MGKWEEKIEKNVRKMYVDNASGPVHWNESNLFFITAAITVKAKI